MSDPDQMSDLQKLKLLPAAIAHEVRNPLALIKGYADILRRGIVTGQLTQAESVEMLTKMEIVCDRISDMLKGLVSMTKKTQDVQFKKVLLRNIVDNVVLLTETRLKENGVKLDVAPIKEEVELCCSPTLVSEVLVNFIQNAGEALSNQKEGSIQLQVEKKGDKVTFTVTDNGPGIAEEMMEKLMEPFTSTKKTSSVSGNLGLGLTICQEIAQLHHGDISSQRVGEETRFSFTLPLDVGARQLGSQPH